VKATSIATSTAKFNPSRSTAVHACATGTVLYAHGYIKGDLGNGRNVPSDAEFGESRDGAWYCPIDQTIDEFAVAGPFAWVVQSTGVRVGEFAGRGE
jgi:hypothetical protein